MKPLLPWFRRTQLAARGAQCRDVRHEADICLIASLPQPAVLLATVLNACANEPGKRGNQRARNMVNRTCRVGSRTVASDDASAKLTFGSIAGLEILGGGSIAAATPYLLVSLVTCDVPLPRAARARIGHSIGLTLASMKAISSASRPYFA